MPGCVMFGTGVTREALDVPWDTGKRHLVALFGLER